MINGLSGDSTAIDRERTKLPFASILILFFLSGFSALLYQVIWQRMLAIFSGVDVFSVTIIIAAFMGGLGFGSMAGGYIADRISNRRRLLLFAASELAIGLFALISKWFYYDVLYMKADFLATSTVTLTIVLFLSLLVPTFFMGLTLPLLSKALTSTVEKASTTIGALYGINTLGAAIGAFITGWVLVRSFGFETTLYIGAFLNFVCAGGALALTKSFKRTGEGGEGEMDKTGYDEVFIRSGHKPLFPFKYWVAIYALSGFIALSLEIIWFRLVTIMVNSTTFTFATLLFIFLTGLAAGILIGITWSKRCKRPVETFFLLQLGITLYAALSLAVLVMALGNVGFLDPLWRHLGHTIHMEHFPIFASVSALLAGSTELFSQNWGLISKFLSINFLLPAVLILPPTIMMGLCFPMLQRAVQTDRGHIGRRVGWLQSANIMGSMAGTFLVGWGTLKLLGTSGTLRALVLISGIFLILWVSVRFSDQSQRRKFGYALAVCFVVLFSFVVPPSATLWSKLHGTTPETIIFEEGASGLTLIRTFEAGRSKIEGETHARILSNGHGVSFFPYGSIRTKLGFLPAFLHPDPQDIAVIGLGSGDTCFAAAGRVESKNVTCIEIMEQQLGVLREFNEVYKSEAIRTLLESDRINLVFTDGRAFIRQSDKLYDFIEADALVHYEPFSGNVYSEEFYTMLKEHLKPGGFAITWVPTERTMRTFIKVFPYVMRFDDLFIGSSDPIMFDLNAIYKRINSDAAREHFEKAGLDIQELAASVFAKMPTMYWPEDDRSGLIDINTDLFPKDEYLVRY